MGIELVPIAGSSQLESSGYDLTTQTLAVRFKSGGATYHYSGVPPEVVDEFGRAESMGSFLHRNIKGTYEFEKIPDQEEAQDGSAT